jgi:SAM-dependent methyltransferase
VSHSTGFSDVEASGSAPQLVDYLKRWAVQLADYRRLDFDRLALRDGEAVLDAGCGAGEVCVEFARRVGRTGRVCGIDPSTTMIEAARAAAAQAGARVEHAAASIYELPYPDDTFDAVRAERVFQHLDDPARGLAELVRVTRPGGRIMVIDPDHSQWALAVEAPLQERVSEATRAELLKGIANPRIGTRLRGLFHAAGLRNVDVSMRVIEIGWADYQPATFLPMRLDGAVAAGAITADEARAFVAEMSAIDAAGRFMANTVGYSVLGVKP